MKKLVFVSNRNNNHQKMLADSFWKIYGSDYTYVAMTPFFRNKQIPAIRDFNEEPYVLRAFESPEAMSEAQKLIDEAECVIVGGKSEYIRLVANRLSRDKLTFVYSERFLKGPLWKDVLRFLKYLKYEGLRTYARDKRSKFYLLCASAFAAWDYNICGLFKGKAYRWGYFPYVTHTERQISQMEASRTRNILWAGRFLKWKHPELAVKLAKNLREMGIEFNMKMIGSGEVHSAVSEMINSLALQDCIEITEAIPAAQVWEEMKNSQIFIFTSDRGEGWGAVLNEAMNSGCAVAAGEKIGSVPYLIKDGHNGIIFRDRDIDDLTVKVAGLLREPERMRELGRNAYETVTGLWSPENAAKRFITLSEALNENGGSVNLWEDGPGSVAPVI